MIYSKQTKNIPNKVFALVYIQMPREYVRKTSKGSWTGDQLKNAIQSIHKSETSIRSAAKLFNIPYSTLRQRVTEEKSVPPRFGTKAVTDRNQYIMISITST